VGQGPLDVKRELDSLVPAYDERAGTPAARHYARRSLRAVAAVLLALAVVAAIVAVLHTHLTAAQTAPAPKKPVQVLILPAQK
jgi:hypothetical protein